jgi:hypothetical protein
VIVDVEATTSVRQAEVTAQRRMIERTQERFHIRPQRLVADAAYGSAANLGWLVDEKSIEPHIPVFDKSARDDGSFERADFIYNPEDDSYLCPGGNRLRRSNRKTSASRGPASIRTALSDIAPVSRTARAASTGSDAHPTCPPARSPAPSTKPLAMWPAISPPPTRISYHAANGRRSKCSSLT